MMLGPARLSFHLLFFCHLLDKIPHPTYHGILGVRPGSRLSGTHHSLTVHSKLSYWKVLVHYSAHTTENLGRFFLHGQGPVPAVTEDLPGQTAG